MAKDLAKDIAARVRAELSRQMKPQKELIELLGISQPQVSERVRGDVEWRISELALVADYLGVPIESFIPQPEAAEAVAL